MDHNNLDIIGDLIAPLSEFLDNFAILTHNCEDSNISQTPYNQHLSATVPNQKSNNPFQSTRHNVDDAFTCSNTPVFDDDTPSILNIGTTRPLKGKSRTNMKESPCKKAAD